MTNDTSYRQKGRAVFLAAIMVLSMVAMSAALAGGVAAEHDPGPEEATWNTDEDERYWQGQTINITQVGTDAEVDVLDSDGNLVRERTADGNGYLEISTEDLGEGDYTLSGDTEEHNFSIAVQEINDASFAPDSTTGDSTLTLDSDRRDYNVTVSAEGLSNADVQAIFDQSDIVHNGTEDDAVVLDVDDGIQNFDANFSAVDSGNYTFEFDVVDTTATASANVTVGDAAGEDVTFGSQSFSGVVGDEMEIDLQFSGGATEGWVNISDDEGFYDATFNVSGVPEDTENVTLTWNTHQAANASANFGFTASEGEIENVSSSGAAFESGSDSLLNRQASFTFESFRDNPTESEFRDVAAVQLNTRTTGETTVWTAPGSIDTTDGNITAIVDQATEDSSIAMSDLLIAQVEATGLYGYTGENVEDFTSNGLNVTFTQSNVGPYSEGSTVNVSALDAASVYTQPDEGQFYVVVDTQNHDNFEADTSWNVNVSIDENNAYVQSSDDEETSSASFDVEQPTAEITGDFSDDDVLQLPNSEDAEVTAETNLAPGTSVNVRMNFPFQFVTATGEVSEDGTFSSSVDLSDFEAGTQFTTRLTAGSLDSVSTESTLSNGTGAGAASFGVTADAPSSAEVDGDASLEYSFSNDGDANGTAEYTVSVGGEEVDSGTANLSSGDSTDTMSYDFDTSEAGDVEWTVETQHDSSSGTLTVEESTDDTGSDDTGGDDTGGDDTGGDGDGDSDDGDDGGQPGFGLIVALFALIGAALLALRRQN